MVLEATMICIDNSEWMRNGDYSPTRFQAIADAVNLICGAKTQSNPENTVGVLTMGGKGVRVLVTPTTDLGKILACMHGLEIGGKMNLTAGIQVAQLALKHRQNKNQQQRIIVFAGSPVKYEKKALETIGKKLKKNSVSLDVVNFGESEDEKSEKLENLVAAVNNNGTSHIFHVSPGPNALSDVLLSTPIFTGDGDGGSGFAAAAAAAAAGGMSGYDFGVDPNIDPELALALRVSMEEERARQEAAAKNAAEDGAKSEKEGEQASCSHDAAMVEPGISSAHTADEKRDDLMVWVLPPFTVAEFNKIMCMQFSVQTWKSKAYYLYDDLRYHKYSQISWEGNRYRGVSAKNSLLFAFRVGRQNYNNRGGECHMTISFEELMGKLMAYEVQMNKREASKKKKDLTHRAKSDSESGHEVKFLFNKICKLYKKNAFRKSKILSSSSEEYQRKEIRCFGCGRKGHVKIECIIRLKEIASSKINDKKTKDKKKAMKAIWDDNDVLTTSSNEDDKAQALTSLCLMGFEDHKHEDDDSALLEQALAMSRDDARSGGGAVADTDMSDATTEDQELAFALQMSVPENAKDSSSQADVSRVLEDQSFVSSILNSLPGVDPNDPSVKDLLASLQGQSEKKSKDNPDDKAEK